MEVWVKWYSSREDCLCFSQFSGDISNQTGATFKIHFQFEVEQTDSINNMNVGLLSMRRPAVTSDYLGILPLFSSPKAKYQAGKFPCSLLLREGVFSNLPFIKGVVLGYLGFIHLEAPDWTPHLLWTLGFVSFSVCYKIEGLGYKE